MTEKIGDDFMGGADPAGLQLACTLKSVGRNVEDLEANTGVEAP